MPEAERVLAGDIGSVGAHQIAADERAQVLVGGCAEVVVAQREDAAAMEHLAFDRGAFDHRSLLLLESVESGAEERLDRWRHGELRVRDPRSPTCRPR